MQSINLIKVELQELLVRLSKRTFLLLLLISLGSKLFGQVRHFFVDSVSERYSINHYTLSTKELYGVDFDVELFNVIYGEELTGMQQKDNLILFSVLPDFKTRTNWTKIDPDSLKKEAIVDFYHFRRMYDDITLRNFTALQGDRTKFFNKYKLIVKKGEHFYVSNNCLLQFYSIHDRHDVFNNIFGTINTQQTPHRIVDFEKIFRQTYKGLEFPLYTLREPLKFSWFSRLRDRREYLSDILTNGEGTRLYKFWTYTDWHEHRVYYEIERGIDRFIYLPEKGIVGGSFDFYFYFHRKELGLTVKDFIDNIRAEKVMLDESIGTIKGTL
ncbi:hypothetical protein [Sphingobacterium deserti]|uniref:Uncharacterized protein n=1 Tax=Sphingobacterium deserti TaxID=1229276 RepID=A0A0B8T0Q0_9SPHI|nr:hypothetical protein [Sphingobacterium deserti]KGE14252.1 hypothetical protein DI53_2082 [Sphingobacterium deserti]